MEVWIALTEHGEEIYGIYLSEDDAKHTAHTINEKHKKEQRCDHNFFSYYDGPFTVQERE